ncbi:ribosome biogenesis GTPase YlqF [Metamycoplasma buccale]|uniref:ribosome biogenesis GTPase YlqF n=1 Tax=Metamycoplasma buccale TaxID=55602 RepID=UPI00398F2987
MINWFPGHMAKEFRLLKEKQKIFDLFIIILDSRIPISSFNSEIYKIAQGKPILFIMNKSDMSDINKLNLYINEYKNRGKIITTNLKNNNSYKKINKLLNEYYLELKNKNLTKNKLTPPLKCVVLGVPNVGKSTFINLMAKSKVAKVGSIAGITKSEQWINCNNYLLLDTPGLLMPNLKDKTIAAKLAIVGSIKQEALNLNELITEIYKLISEVNPSALKIINLDPATSEEMIFNNITKFAKDNNLLLKDNKLNINKAINMLISYFKNLNNIIYD